MKFGFFFLLFRCSIIVMTAKTDQPQYDTCGTLWLPGNVKQQKHIFLTRWTIIIYLFFFCLYLPIPFQDINLIHKYDKTTLSNQNSPSRLQVYFCEHNRPCLQSATSHNVTQKEGKQPISATDASSNSPGHGSALPAALPIRPPQQCTGLFLAPGDIKDFFKRTF